jgi:hypothetical protein
VCVCVCVRAPGLVDVFMCARAYSLAYPAYNAYAPYYVVICGISPSTKFVSLSLSLSLYIYKYVYIYIFFLVFRYRPEVALGVPGG